MIGCRFVPREVEAEFAKPRVRIEFASRREPILRPDTYERDERVKKAGSTTDPLWYKDAVIYEIHVRAFQDSNADGIGDFPGIMSRLDYLQDLGVTCLWLLPFFPSPLR